MVITDETSTVEKNEDTLEREGTATIGGTEDYDIVRALSATGHRISTYPNGIVLGVLTEGIPDRRGVHLDLAYVLDLRRASFGKATIAMQAAVLETLNRTIVSALKDVHLDDSVKEVTKLTSKGRISLQMLRAGPNHKGSLIHLTKTVYVIVSETRPGVDLTWLTESSRILNADDFLLARRSDMRASLSEMQNRVIREKWDILDESMKQAWFGILATMLSIIGAVSILGVLFQGEGSMVLPIGASILGIAAGAWLLFSSRRRLDEFLDIIQTETIKVNKVGDGHRINQSIEINKEKLRTQQDLSFVVSPLMASVAGSISVGDYDSAVSAACLVLDECVRHSTSRVESLGDDGLSKFAGLFNSLGTELDESELAISYVAFSNHILSPLTEDEILKHSTMLTDTLYNSGILRPSVKDRIDDLMNSRAMKENLKFLDREISEHPAGEIQNDPEEDDWLVQEISTADAEHVLDEIPEIEAKTRPTEEYDGVEDDTISVANQLDELSEIVRGDSRKGDVEPTALDVLASIAESHSSTEALSKHRQVEEDATSD
ncbi:MAG: hypothetical protein ACFFD3_04545 [Candidatus Thorarchaeota archaeon]